MATVASRYLLENENKSQSICYPYSDCYQPHAVRIGIANTLGYIFIL